MKYLCENLTPNIKKLNLEGCRTTLTNENILELVKRCNTLEELDISDSSTIESPAIDAIVLHLTKTLKKVSLSRCFAILPEDYVKFGAMQNLQFLNIYGMLSDIRLEVVKQQLPRIIVNDNLFSNIARPATGNRRNVLWDIKFPHPRKNFI